MPIAPRWCSCLGSSSCRRRRRGWNSTQVWRRCVSRRRGRAFAYGHACACTAAASTVAGPAGAGDVSMGGGGAIRWGLVCKLGRACGCCGCGLFWRVGLLPEQRDFLLLEVPAEQGSPLVASCAGHAAEQAPCPGINCCDAIKLEGVHCTAGCVSSQQPCR